MADSSDVLILGGGIIGLTTALRLRERGATVAVYDRGDFGREASWAGAGIIPPGNPERATNPIDRLRAIGSQLLPTFSEELRDLTGIDNGYRQNGGIEFLSEADEYAIDLWNAEGLAYEKLTDSSLPELEPSLTGWRPTPFYLPQMAQLRNPWHVRALIQRCQQLGVSLFPNHGIERWQLDGEQVVGVRLINGTIVSAAEYLVAAGPWSGRLLDNLNFPLPVAPIRGQILLLQTDATIISRTVIDGKRYLVPRGDGRILVGSTEEPDAGFAKETTQPALSGLRDFAVELVPSLWNAATEAFWAGLRPGTPDGLPFISRVPNHANVTVATGHGRAGVQLSLGTAQLVTECLTGDPTCVPLDAFALDRRPDVRPRPAFRS